MCSSNCYVVDNCTYSTARHIHMMPEKKKTGVTLPIVHRWYELNLFV